jgi:Tol biopolymer transport system component
MSLLAFLFASCRTETPPPPPEAWDPTACFRELTTTLSADELGGRGIGTDGLDRAASLLEDRYRAAGLGDAGVGHRQPFDAVTGVELGVDNTLNDGAALTPADFTPLGFTTNGAFSGEVVFAGYGITATELGYDDYAGLDVKGKVVLALRYEPGETDEASPFDGKRASRWSDLRYKAMRARELGAAALVLVAPSRQPDEPDKLPPLVKGGPTSRAGVPVVQVTRAVADRWLKASGTSVGEARSAIDLELAPGAPKGGKGPRGAITGLKVAGTTEVRPTSAGARNVVAVLPGSGALADEVIVVGAHYDHLGMGEEGSMRPDSHAIHNGADDNASGTAALVCAFEHLAKAPPTGDRRTLVALSFSAEEIGLGGSAWYTDHPLFPLEKTVGMINLDMVGRVRDGKLAALGTDSAPEWAAPVTAAAEKFGLTVNLGGDGYGPSDHSSFYEKQIPVVHFFSGSHEQYHTPDDDAPTLNMEGGAQVVRMLDDLVRAVSTRPEKLTYVRSVSGPPSAGDSRGYGAWLGTVPDMTADEAALGGVRLSDVRAGGPAEAAGVKAGDVLVGLAGAKVQNLYDMSFLLQDHKPGETVDVVVKRDGAELVLRATLGQRKGAGGPPPGVGGASNNRPDHGDFSVGAEPAGPGPWRPTAGKAVPEMLDPKETHLADLRQLTFGGENAEAYWTPDGKHVTLQRTPVPGTTCDQEYVFDLTTGEMKLLSSGKGRTTCGYADYPAGERYIYATTEAAGPECPPSPDMSQGYVWSLYPSYDMYWHTPGKPPEPFLAAPGYDAEATACMKDGRIVFTSTRSGDLELYTVDRDGANLAQVTDTPGYDGGAFFNPACTALVWRASRPEGEALADYQRLLKQDLVRPSALEIFWMDLATKKVEQLTKNGAANFAPYPLPDDSGVLYASNAEGNGREFDVWMAKRAGGASERVTHVAGFDGFPMFSPDGKWLMFASNRATEKGKNDTNLFVARWVP